VNENTNLLQSFQLGVSYAQQLPAPGCTSVTKVLILNTLNSKLTQKITNKQKSQVVTKAQILKQTFGSRFGSIIC
jgi:hypothetical protein